VLDDEHAWSHPPNLPAPPGGFVRGRPPIH
jgi:hypothetical protein